MNIKETEIIITDIMYYKIETGGARNRMEKFIDEKYIFVEQKNVNFFIAIFIIKKEKMTVKTSESRLFINEIYNNSASVWVCLLSGLLSCCFENG